MIIRILKKIYEIFLGPERSFGISTASGGMPRHPAVLVKLLLIPIIIIIALEYQTLRIAGKVFHCFQEAARKDVSINYQCYIVSCSAHHVS